MGIFFNLERSRSNLNNSLLNNMIINVSPQGKQVQYNTLIIQRVLTVNWIKRHVKRHKNKKLQRYKCKCIN